MIPFLRFDFDAHTYLLVLTPTRSGWVVWAGLQNKALQTTTSYDQRMKYDISPAKRDEVRPLFEEFHAYGTLGAVSTYLFAVYENDKPVAAYAWMPAP
jgi:hypothetical protein